MIKKIKAQKTLSQEEKILLKSYFPLARKYAYYLIQEKSMDLTEVSKICQNINATEINLKTGIWKNKMLEKMQHRHFENLARMCFRELTKPEANLEKTLSFAKKLFVNAPDVELGIFIEYVEDYNKKISEFNKKAFDMLCKGVSWNAIMKWVEKLNIEEEINDENRLFILQTMKHINKLRKYGLMPSFALLKIVLNSKYAGNLEILDEQIHLINSCYDENNFTEAASCIRNLCYDFIRGCVKNTGYFHVNLINFLFKGDWISEQTFNLLKEAKEAIFKNGMQILIQVKLNKLYPQIAKKEKLDEKDYFILELAKLYECC